MARNEERDSARREAAIQQLLNAALAAFSEGGIEGTSLSQVARRAGVSKGLIFHYFPTKDALVEAVMARRLAEMKALGEGLPEGVGPGEALSIVAHRMVASVEADPGAFRLYLRALAGSAGSEIAARAVARLAPAPDPLIEAFRALGAEDPEGDARLFQSAMLGILTQRAISPRGTPPGPLVERLLHVLNIKGGPHDPR